MAFLSQRRRVPEIMDQPDLDEARHQHALRGLARLNFIGLSTRALWQPLRALARELRRPLRILDVATGAGDVPLRLWRLARGQRLGWQFEGCDRSPVAVEHARAQAERAGARSVSFFVHDVFAGPLPGTPDAVTCSLFLHHLADDEAVDLLRRFAATGARLVLVDDLCRDVFGLALTHLATRLLTTSRVVHFDGPRSVEAAFTPAEALALAGRAGLAGATVTPHWPYRWLLAWRQP
jgi:hypothetical protein